MSFKIHAALSCHLALVFCFASLADRTSAEVVGNDPVLGTGQDTALGVLWRFNVPFSVDGAISSFEFFAVNTGLRVTPVLWHDNGGGEFEIVGIGTTRTSSSGLQNYPFGLAEGTDHVGAQTYFGFKQGTKTEHDAGAVRADGLGPDCTSGINCVGLLAARDPSNVGDPHLGISNIAFRLGSSFNQNANEFRTDLAVRDYSIRAISTDVPEPSSLVIIAIGASLIAGYRLRRTRSARS